MGIVSQLSEYGKRVVAELQMAGGNPQPRSVDRQVQTVRTRAVDKHIPDKKKMERFWELYKNVSFIRNPIRGFSSEVIAPGYYVDAEDEELAEELEEWLETSCIVDGEVDKNFSLLLKKATIQREVKGSALVEKVRDEENNFYGFKLLKPETVRAYTYPGQTVLLPPDAEVDNDDVRNSGFLSSDVNIRHTPDGDVAAYAQLTADMRRWSNTEDGYISFTRDDIIKLTRDSDTGEVFGTSRLYGVEDRLESLLSKLDHNDKAIESVANKSLIYQLGTAENPADPEKVKDFADAHKQEKYEPGLKQFLQGHINVEEISGEVADIEPYLNWDLNAIMSDMPMPKYSLGAFESDVNQFISRSQSARLERQLKDARNEIQDEWTPTLKEKAEELGYDPEDVNSLVIGDDPRELGLPELQEDGDDVPENRMNAPEDGEGPAGENTTRPPASTEPDRDGGEGIE